LGDSGGIEPEKLPYQPFDSISFDRIARLPADSDPQPRYAQPVLFGNGDKMPRMIAFSRSIYVDKIRSIQ